MELSCIYGYIIRMTDRTKDFNELDKTEKYDRIMQDYDTALEAWKGIRDTYSYEIDFALMSNQWDTEMRSARESMGRQVYTKNVLGKGIDYVVNNFKANPCAIKCHPVGGESNKNEAELLNGLIRYIQYKDNAVDTYGYAYQNQLAGGLGAWRVMPVEDEVSGKKELEIQRVLDPMMVIIDPNAKKKDFRDASYIFMATKISKAQFIAEYGEENLDDLDMVPGWGNKDFVQIAEYWRRSIVYDTKVEMVPGKKPVKTQIKRIKIDQYIINGNKIIYENLEYPGKYIPIILVTGNEAQIGDTRIFKSFIHDVVNDQKFLNIAKSEIMDSLLATNKTRWLLEPEMLGTNGELKKMWDYSASNAFPYLLAKNKDGRMPTEITPAPISQAYTEGAAEALNDIKMGIGIKDTSEDLPAGLSGKSIRLSISEKNVQSYGFLANLQAGIKYTGEIMLDLIQYYYTEADILQILGKDDQIQAVPVNQEFNQNGKMTKFDLSRSAQYGCIISTGPSYMDAKSEALDTLMTLSKEMPILSQVAGDLIAQNLSVENADLIAARVRSTLSPTILAASSSSNLSDEDLQNKIAVLQNENAQLKQLTQMGNQYIQQLGSQLKDATDANKLKLQIQREKMQGDAQMHNLDHQSEITKMRIEQSQEDKIAVLEAQVKLLIAHLSGQQKMDQIDATQAGKFQADTALLDQDAQIQTAHKHHDFVADSALLAQDALHSMHNLEHSIVHKPSIGDMI